MLNFCTFATDAPRNNYLHYAVVYKANQLWETFYFDLKNSCSLKLFKNELSN